MPDQEELKLMFDVVNNTKCRSEKFMTKIICSIDWPALFSSVNRRDLPDTTFYLTYILVKTSFKKSDLNIDQYPFHCINVKDLTVLAKIIEEKVQIEEYLINQNESSELMFTILEMGCFVNVNQKKILENIFDSLETNADKENLINDLQQRRLIYSRTFCEILCNSVKNNSSIYKKYPSELKMFFADFLYRVRIFEKGKIIELFKLSKIKLIIFLSFLKFLKIL